MKPALLALCAAALASAQPLQVHSGQRILFMGDSITRGYAFGNYADPSPLRTLAGVAAILLSGNMPRPSQPLTLAPVWQGLNPDGSPKTVATLAGEVKVIIRRGDMRPGDWLVFEDAGELDKFVHPAPWPNDRNIYRRYRKSLRDMVHEAELAVGREHILLMTMFDYQPECKWCDWDAPLDDGVHSANDAIRDEAAALGVRVVDMNGIMDAANAHIAARKYGRVVGPDGVHPNVYGNYVMALGILDALGCDVAGWNLDGLARHFRHRRSGGDVDAVWGFNLDPSDEERIALLHDLRGVVLGRPKLPPPQPRDGPTAHTFRRIVRHGRILDRPARQPEGTAGVASYELGKLLQLDRDHVMLVASLREKGGHDFCIGNDAIVFRDIPGIDPGRAVPVNRVEPDYRLKSGTGYGVQAKFPASGAFVPLGAKLENGLPHPHAGTGFLLSTSITYLPDRSKRLPNGDQYVEFLQASWDGRSLRFTKDRLPDAPFGIPWTNVGFQCLPEGAGFLCPVVSLGSIVVARFERRDGRWQAVAAGPPFRTGKFETEPSIHKVEDDYMVYTRGVDSRRGRVYQSSDGLRYHLLFEHVNHTVPQVLNQGLDGSLYLATNTGPGWLRNPLLLFALHGHSFIDPVAVHDEQQVHEDRSGVPGKQVPFVDHAVGANVSLNGRWRHLLLYRVLDLRETNGEGAPPTPQTGLYLSELDYRSAAHAPFRF